MQPSFVLVSLTSVQPLFLSNTRDTDVDADVPLLRCSFPRCWWRPFPGDTPRPKLQSLAALRQERNACGGACARHAGCLSTTRPSNMSKQTSKTPEDAWTPPYRPRNCWKPQTINTDIYDHCNFLYCEASSKDSSADKAASKRLLVLLVGLHMRCLHKRDVLGTLDRSSKIYMTCRNP